MNKLKNNLLFELDELGKTDKTNLEIKKEGNKEKGKHVRLDSLLDLNVNEEIEK